MRIFKYFPLIPLLFAFFVHSALAAAPTVSSFSPADGTQNVASTTNSLSITFDQAVQGSAGNITLYDGNGTQIEQIAGNDAQVTGSGTTTLTIALTSRLGSSNTNYYVQIQSTAILNGIGEFYAGISDTTTWNFKSVFVRGGASKSGRLERIRSMPPTYHNTVSPSLSAVGIFLPSIVAKSPPSSERKEKLHAATYRIKVIRSREEFRRAARRFRPAASKYRPALQERVCNRVQKRFGRNLKEVRRINARLQNTFGFECNL